MRVAICPGSFDPITLGHIDIIKRAAKLFDKVVVLVMSNASKNPTFSLEERMGFIDKACAGIVNVEVDTYEGLLAEYASKIDATVIVKGLRAMSDFEYEFQMALTNRKLNKNIETTFLTSSAEYMYLSSSLVKQVASLGGSVAEFVPSFLAEDIEKNIRERIER